MWRDKKRAGRVESEKIEKGEKVGREVIKKTGKFRKVGKGVKRGERRKKVRREVKR